MAVTLTTAARNAACDAVVDLCDAGAGAATLQISTAAFATLLCTITLADPAFGASAVGVATLAGLPKAGLIVANGTAAVYKVLDSTGTECWRGTTAELTLSTTTFVTGKVVVLSAGTHTQPA